MQINIKCEGSNNLRLDELSVLQGELKSLSKQNYQKLKKEILELGFSSPIHYWHDGDKNWILDGTQRYKTLNQMQQDGFTIPALPVVKVEAKDVNEAKKKILALTSQYGKIEGDGLYEFMVGTDLTVDEIEDSFVFPELNLKNFKQEFWDETADIGSESEPVQKEEYLVICECQNESEQSALFEQLSSQGISCKII